MNSRLQSKAISILIASLSCAAVAGFAVKQANPFEPVTASRSYKLAGLGSIDWVGTCKATSESIDCWNTDGNPDPDLTEKIKAFYIVQTNTDLHFKFGRKNRLVVFRRPQNGGPEFTITNTSTDSGQFLNESGQLGMNGGNREPYLGWYSVDTDPSLKMASVVFDITSNQGNATIPFKEGAEGSIGSARIHIDSIKLAEKGKGGNSPRFTPDRTWTVSVTISGFTASTVPNISGRAFDQKGNMVYRVDTKGDPLSEETTRRMYSPGFNPVPGFDASLQCIKGYGSAHQDLSIPVNPSKAASLWLGMSGTRKVTITDILLDPK